MIEINNLTPAPVDKNFLKKVAGKIIKKEKKLLELSIALVGPAKIKKLNKEYRKKNKITDVLSFLYSSEAKSGEARRNKFLLPSRLRLDERMFFDYNDAGEIVICPQQVKKNAAKYNSTFKYELTRVLIHGILHLLGENHEISKKKAKKMEQKQEYYLTRALAKSKDERSSSTNLFLK